MATRSRGRPNRLNPAPNRERDGHRARSVRRRRIAEIAGNPYANPYWPADDAAIVSFALTSSRLAHIRHAPRRVHWTRVARAQPCVGLAEKRRTMRRLREIEMTPDAETETGEPDEATTIIEINSDSDD